MRQLSDILREKLKELGDNKSELAEKLGVTDGSIHHYMNGGTVPKMTFAVAWMQAFGENLIELMFADEPAKVSEPMGGYNSPEVQLKEKEKTVQLLTHLGLEREGLLVYKDNRIHDLEREIETLQQEVLALKKQLNGNST